MKTYLTTSNSLRYSGYTFVEILIVISLILLALLISAPRLGKSFQEQSEIRSAAMRLTEDLRYLRQLAITSGAPTALVIPNDDLTKSHCQGYILKKGLIGSEIIRIVDFHRLYNKGFLFVGFWNIDSSKLHNPSLGNSGDSIKKYANSSGFDVGSWGNDSKDYIFLFTPEGTVIANGNMPHFDNAYHIVAGEYFEYAPASLPGGAGSTEPGSLTAHFQLSGARDPAYTVALTPAGEVSCERGITAADEGVTAGTGSIGPGEGASLYGASASNTSPEISSIRIYPAGLKPLPGIDTIVSSQKQVKFLVYGRDSNRDQLYLKAEVGKAPNMADPGVFSSGSIPMEYDPVTGTYQGVILWSPPASAKDEDVFEISLYVSDARSQASAVRIVKIINKDQICFCTNRDGNYEIYIMYVDGSFPENLTLSATRDSAASWSLNGGTLAFISNRLYGYDDIFMTNNDGTDPFNITRDSAVDKDPSWSPNGAKLAFSSVGLYGNYDIYTINANGTNEEKLLSTFWGNASNEISPSWSPDTTQIAFASELYGNYDIYLMDAEWGMNPVNISNDADIDISPCWSPDGKKMAFASNRDGNYEIYVMDADGTSQYDISNNPADDTEPSWSPDGKKIAFTSTRDGNREIYIMNSDGTSQLNISNNPAEDRMPQFGK